MARSQAIPEDTRASQPGLRQSASKKAMGFAASVDLHAVYATTLPSGNDSVRPPHRPMTSTESGLAVRSFCSDAQHLFGSCFLAFRGPIPLTMKNTSFAPQRAGERGSATSAILSERALPPSAKQRRCKEGSSPTSTSIVQDLSHGPRPPNSALFNPLLTCIRQLDGRSRSVRP